MSLYAGHYSALSGQDFRPLLDRIDIHIEVPAVAYKELRGKDEMEVSPQPYTTLAPKSCYDFGLL
jgi:hypothetical protein